MLFLSAVFACVITGEDALGNPHRYSRTRQFTPEDGVSGRLRKEICLSLPAGTYTVEEKDVIRYQLSGIYGITNGTADGKKVMLFKPTFVRMILEISTRVIQLSSEI